MIWIKSAYIEAFGGMKEREFSFTPGLNLLVGDNGSGKSTLSAFIRFVLYGFSDRDDRKKWMPLDLSAAGGVLTLVSGEETYRIERRVGGRHTDEAVILRSDGSAAFVGRVPGEVFFGLPLDGFLRSAYIRQEGAGADSDRTPALDNLLFAADENMNVGAALKRLDAARVELWHKNKKGGQLHQLTLRRDELRDELRLASSENTELIALEGMISEGKDKLTKSSDEITRLEGQIAAHAVLQYEERKKELSRLASGAKEKAEAYAALEDRGLANGYRPDYADRDRLRELLSRRDALGNALEETAKALEAERVKKASLPDHAKLIREAGGEEALLSSLSAAKKDAESGKKGSIALLLLSVFCAVGGLVLLLLPYTVPAVVLLLLAAAAAGGALLLHGKQNRAKAKTASLLSSVLVGSEEELTSLLRSLHNAGRSEEERLLDRQSEQEEERTGIVTRLAAWAEKTGTETGEDAAAAIEGHFEALRSLHTEAEAALSAFRSAKKLFDAEPIPESTDVMLPKSFSIETAKRNQAFYRRQNELLTAQTHERELRYAELNAKHSDPALLSEQLSALERQIEEKRARHDALVLAGDALNRASANLRATVSPRLSRDASEYLSALTDGEYDTIGVDEGLAMHCRVGSATVSPDYLSGGTQADAYFSLRLALLRLLCPGRLPPLLLDETFVFLDPARLRRAMELLRSLTGEQQILLFSATGREIPEEGRDTVIYL